MPNQYGLVIDTKKYGDGSFYAPFDTSRSKALRIDPIGSGDFSIAASQDFYFSVWIKYGTINVSSINARYPIIKYGSQQNNSSGWELGLKITQVGGGYSALPYFSFIPEDVSGTSTTITTTFNGSNGNLIQPTGDFDRWEVSRTSGVITLRFNGVNTSNTSTTYNGRIGSAVNQYATANNEPDYRGIFVGSEQPFVINQDNGAYIDDLFFATGISSVVNTLPDGSINDGKLSTTEFLYKFDQSYADTITQYQSVTAALTVTASVAADITRLAIVKDFGAQLTVTASVTAESSSEFLTLLYNPGGSGYITSNNTGEIRSTITNRTISGTTYSGWDPVVADLWLKLASPMTVGQRIVLYTSGATRLSLEYVESDYYSLNVEYTINYSRNFSSVTSTSWGRYSASNASTTRLPTGFNPTQWHNYLFNLIPGRIESYNWPATAGGVIGNAVTTSTLIDGVEYYTVAQQIGNPTLVSNESSYQLPTMSTTLSGEWGSTANPVTIYLDQLWITNNTYVSGSNWSGPPATEFINNGAKTLISDTGLTAGNYQAQVWLSFRRNLLDGATAQQPNWNYTRGNGFVVIGLVQNFSATLTVTTSLTASGGLRQQAQANLQTTTTITTANDRIRFATQTVALQSAVTVSAVAQKNVAMLAAMTTTSTVASTASRTRPGQANLQTLVSMSVSAVKTARITETLTSQTALSVDIARSRPMSVALTSAFTSSATVIKTVRTGANFAAMAAEITVINKIGRTFVDLNATTTVTVTGRVTADRPVAMIVTTALSVQARKVVIAQGAFESAVAVTASIDKLRSSAVALTTQSAVSAQINVIRAGQMTVTTTSEFTAQVNRLRGISAVVAAQSTMTTANQAVKLAQANLTSTSTVVVETRRLKVFTANLQVSAFNISIITVQRIDPALTLYITSESRVLTIHQETRLLGVKSESRVNIIQG